MFSDTGRLLKVALAGWWNDRAMSLGAAIAFFTVFSLAPMLLAAIAVAGLAFSREAAQGAIVDELGGLIGRPGAALEAMIASAGNVDSGIVGTGDRGRDLSVARYRRHDGAPGRPEHRLEGEAARNYGIRTSSARGS